MQAEHVVTAAYGADPEADPYFMRRHAMACARMMGGREIRDPKATGFSPDVTYRMPDGSKVTIGYCTVTVL